MGEDIDLIQHLDNVDLTTLDRSRKVVKGGTYDVTIQKIEVKDTNPTAKNPKKGKRIAITLALNTKAELNEGGGVVDPGFLIFDSISMTPTDKYNPLERLADIQLATYGAQKVGFKVPDYIGRRAMVKIKIEDSEDYGEQNRVTRWLPLKDPTANQQSAVGQM